MDTEIFLFVAREAEKIEFKNFNLNSKIVTFGQFWCFLDTLGLVFLAYLGHFKSKSLIQGHFWKLEIKGFHLAPRFGGFYSMLMKILASKQKGKNARFCDVACTKTCLYQKEC